MLVKLIMKVLSNLLGNNSKIKYTEIGVQKDNKILNIKEYVDNGDVYSFNEVKTNKIWIDKNGVKHACYKKVYDCGELPNTGIKEINMDINNFSHLIEPIRGFTYKDNGVDSFPLPNANITDIQYVIDLSLTATQTIRIRTGTDRSMLKAYVILEYTKTTD